MTGTSFQKLTREITAQAEQFDEIFANDDPFDELWEAPLEVTTRTQLVVVLCTGGPHVEAVAGLDNDGAIVSASIVGYWGGETVQQPVKPGSSLWRALREYSETVRMSA
ncbi:MAG: hypothetical protein LCH36_07065 [Actinobacteria bacterium]|nr:hypothetical protein [Actinomycetota bacterium]